MVAIINARILSRVASPFVGKGEGEGNPFEDSWRLRCNPHLSPLPLAEGRGEMQIAAP
jgi:hypothetical protein